MRMLWDGEIVAGKRVLSALAKIEGTENHMVRIELEGGKEAAVEFDAEDVGHLILFLRQVMEEPSLRKEVRKWVPQAVKGE